MQNDKAIEVRRIETILQLPAIFELIQRGAKDSLWRRFGDEGEISNKAAVNIRRLLGLFKTPVPPNPGLQALIDHGIPEWVAWASTQMTTPFPGTPTELLKALHLRPTNLRYVVQFLEKMEKSRRLLTISGEVVEDGAIGSIVPLREAKPPVTRAGSNWTRLYMLVPRHADTWVAVTKLAMQGLREVAIAPMMPWVPRKTLQKFVSSIHQEYAGGGQGAGRLPYDPDRIANTIEVRVQGVAIVEAYKTAAARMNARVGSMAPEVFEKAYQLYCSRARASGVSPGMLLKVNKAWSVLRATNVGDLVIHHRKDCGHSFVTPPRRFSDRACPICALALDSVDLPLHAAGPLLRQDSASDAEDTGGSDDGDATVQAQPRSRGWHEAA